MADNNNSRTASGNNKTKFRAKHSFGKVTKRSKNTRSSNFSAGKPKPVDESVKTNTDAAASVSKSEEKIKSLSAQMGTNEADKRKAISSKCLHLNSDFALWLSEIV